MHTVGYPQCSQVKSLYFIEETTKHRVFKQLLSFKVIHLAQTSGSN